MRLSVYFAASAPCWLFHLAAHFRDRRHCESAMRSRLSRNHLLSLVTSTSNFFYSVCDNKCKRNLHRILRTATPTKLGFQSFFVFSKFICSSTITKPFFSYRKDWSRVGVATLEKIGQDWGKRLEKGLAEDWMFFSLSTNDKSDAGERERHGATRTGHT